MMCRLEPDPQKDPVVVEKAAFEVHKFLLDDNNTLRQFVSAASDGAVHFVASVHVKAAAGFVKYREEEGAVSRGKSLDEFKAVARQRLCDPAP